MNVLQLVDLAKEKTGSDYATAEQLGVDRRVVSAWRRGKARPDLVNGVRLCRVAGVDPAKAIEGMDRQATPVQQQQARAGGNIDYTKLLKVISDAFTTFLNALAPFAPA